MNTTILVVVAIVIAGLIVSYLYKKKSNKTSTKGSAPSNGDDPINAPEKPKVE